MTVEISSALLGRLLAEAAECPEQEACGLLLGPAGRINAALPCRNVAADPRSAFEIDPATLIAAHRAERAGGAPIVGCYHSHPHGPPLPSARDAAAAAPDGRIWLILAGGDAGFYRAVEHGRHHGRFDDLHPAIVRCCNGSAFPE